MGGDQLSALGSARAKQVLLECAERLAPGDALASTLRTAAHRLDEPMRLAVVGQVKRGKSTLVNALLAENILATGRPELTFNVNEIYFADTETILVHFRDGAQAQNISRSELGHWANYDAANLADIRRVRKISFGLPNELLHKFRLIDTPGLGSILIADSEATFSALGLNSETADFSQRAALHSLGRDEHAVHNESSIELDQADAVLYLFSRGIHQQDRTVLSGLSGASPDSLTPLKAFGVLSKCDDYWPPDPDQFYDADPLSYHPLRDGANAVIEGYLGRPDIKQLFYTIVPIAARVAAGACDLDADEFNWLDDLAHAQPARLAEDLSDESTFTSRPDAAIPITARRRLIERIGPWGIHLACQALREHCSQQETRAYLIEESGVEELRRLITRHFGNRATLIKLSQAVRSARAGLAVSLERGNQTAEDIGRRIEFLERSEQGFVEIAALSGYYKGHLTDFSSEEIDHLLEVTGERGTHCASRLGLDVDSSLATLAKAAVERVRYWTERSNDPLLERESRQTARTLIRSYENIAHRIRMAMKFLEMVD